MYAGIRDHIITGAGYESVLEGCNALDLYNVEIAMDRELNVLNPLGGTLCLADKAQKAEFKRIVESEGLKLDGILLPTNFNHPELEKELDWVVQVTRLAEEFGIEAIRIDAVMSGERELPLDERVAKFASAMQAIIERTSDSQVEYGVENHGFQGNDPDFLERLFAAAGSERVGLTMDTGNFYWAGHPLEKVYEILERLAPYTKHTHVKNISYPEEMRNQQRPLGYEYGKYVCPVYEGDIDHERVAGILKKVGYQRGFNLEDESLGKFDLPERLEVLKRDVDYLKSLCD